MKRRDFLKTTAVAAAGLGLLSRLPGGRLLAAGGDDGAGDPDLVAVRGGEPAAMFAKAIAEYGGMAAFVKPGSKVVVKPNIGWDRPPEMGADTNPELVEAIVAACVAAGAAEVAVFDHTCNEWSACYRASGIADAVERAGGVMHHAHRQEDYRQLAIPKARNMKEALVHRLIPECDVLINVPVFKHHGGANITGAMKNYMGVVWDRRFMHSNDLHQCIADSVLIRPPDLNVVDAYRVMKTGGPSGNARSEIALLKLLILSRDPVAADTAAGLQTGFDLTTVPHLKQGEELGLGSTDLGKMDIRRILIDA